MLSHEARLRSFCKNVLDRDRLPVTSESATDERTTCPLSSPCESNIVIMVVVQLADLERIVEPDFTWRYKGWWTVCSWPGLPQKELGRNYFAFANSLSAGGIERYVPGTPSGCIR